MTPTSRVTRGLHLSVSRRLSTLPNEGTYTDPPDTSGCHRQPQGRVGCRAAGARRVKESSSSCDGGGEVYSVCIAPFWPVMVCSTEKCSPMASKHPCNMRSLGVPCSALACCVNMGGLRIAQDVASWWRGSKADCSDHQPEERSKKESLLRSHRGRGVQTPHLVTVLWGCTLSHPMGGKFFSPSSPWVKHTAPHTTGASSESPRSFYW
jgi:hypothetical protein